MTTTTPQTRDEAQIRQLIADQTTAICTKALDRIMTNYAPDVVVFDVKPPFQLKGAETLRRMWEASLPCMPNSSGMEQRDLCITVSADVALAHWIFRFTGIDPDHPVSQMWFRATAGCQRRQNQWQIIHEHLSFPFDPATFQAVFTLDS